MPTERRPTWLAVAERGEGRRVKVLGAGASRRKLEKAFPYPKHDWLVRLDERAVCLLAEQHIVVDDAIVKAMYEGKITLPNVWNWR